MIGFIFAFLAIFGVFFLLNKGGGRDASSGSLRYSSSASHCDGNTCSIR